MPNCSVSTALASMAVFRVVTYLSVLHSTYRCLLSSQRVKPQRGGKGCQGALTKTALLHEYSTTRADGSSRLDIAHALVSDEPLLFFESETTRENNGMELQKKWIHVNMEKKGGMLHVELFE